MKPLILVSVITVAAIVIYNKETVVDSVKEKSDIAAVENNTIITESVNKIASVSSSAIPNYKDVFQEPKDVPKIETLQDERELSRLDEDTKQLIAQAERIIKDNNLVIPQRELSAQEVEKIAKIDEKLEKAKQKLEELTNED